MKTLQHLEATLGFQLPELLYKFLKKPKESDLYQPLLEDEFCSLKRTDLTIPLRVMPLLDSEDANVVGLYFPRINLDKPIVVFIPGGEGAVIPLTRDLKAFFSNPDHFHPLSPFYERNITNRFSKFYDDLLYDLVSPTSYTE